MQARQWQYLDTFVRNQDLAGGDVDEEVLREIAEAMPELDPDQWASDFDSPETEELVREDAMLAAELELPAEPAIVVSGPGGQRELIETPTLAEVEEAIAQVSADPDFALAHEWRRRRVSSSIASRRSAPIQMTGSVGESSSSRLPR